MQMSGRLVELGRCLRAVSSLDNSPWYLSFLLTFWKEAWGWGRQSLQPSNLLRIWQLRTVCQKHAQWLNSGLEPNPVPTYWLHCKLLFQDLQEVKDVKGGVKNVLWLITEEAEWHTDEDVGKQEAHRSYYETEAVFTYGNNWRPTRGPWVSPNTLTSIGGFKLYETCGWVCGWRVLKVQHGSSFSTP